jgi:DnaJ-domain-containing protein 1
VDQIFDRLERLFKSWAAGEGPAGGGQSASGRRASGDSDLDDAMAELDDFLDKDRLAAEAREKEREARRAREEAARAAAGWGGYRPPGPDPRLVEAYRLLGLAYGSPFPAVKSAYKRLLAQHHPDRHANDPVRMREATALSARYNAAYQLIETWTETGRMPTE